MFGVLCMSNFRSPIIYVAIKQAFCARTYGNAPCTANRSADYKCYNTRSTCQDTANYLAGNPLTLYFCTPEGAVNPPVPYVIPSLKSVSTSPTKINLASSNPDAQGLGNRALATIAFTDHPHTDRIVDPYLEERSWGNNSWGAYNTREGSYWTRWLARNKYKNNIEVSVYRGCAGDTLEEMTEYKYFLYSVSGPEADGSFTIQVKDILAQLEERNAQAPAASFGKLYAEITDAATSFEVSGALLSEYETNGVLAVGSEVISYTSVVESENGLTFSGAARGAYNTAAATHSAETLVQRCLVIDNMRVDDLASMLMQDYAGINSSWLSLSDWASEVDRYMSFYRVSGIITAPTGVGKLVSELQTQTLCNFWWDERTATVNMRAVRGIDTKPLTLNDSTNLIKGSLRITEKPRERASQVWVYYNQINPTQKLENETNFSNLFVIANLESETEDLYGSPSVRKIYGRWLTSSALAETTANKTITRYVDIPRQVSFELDLKDRTVWVGDTVFLDHYNFIDEFGARAPRQWTIISAEEIGLCERIKYVAEDTTLYGKIYTILPADAPNYQGDGSDSYSGCYIGDADGLLSDGTNCGRVS